MNHPYHSASTDSKNSWPGLTILVHTLRSKLGLLILGGLLAAGAGFAISKLVLTSPPAPGSLCPHTACKAFVSGLLGLGITASAIALRQIADPPVCSSQDARRITNLAVLGEIAHFDQGEREGNHTGPLLAIPDAAVRSVQEAIAAENGHGIPGSLLITSPAPGDGKSTVAANLGALLARDGHPVLLVEGDLYRPTLQRKLGLRCSGGFTDIVHEPPSGLLKVIQETAIPGLFILTAGTQYKYPADLLSSPRATRLIDQLFRIFDVVLIDAPPLMIAESDTILLASFVEAVMIVLRAGKTSRENSRLAVRRLHLTETEIIGSVLTDVRTLLKREWDTGPIEDISLSGVKNRPRYLSFSPGAAPPAASNGRRAPALRHNLSGGYFYGANLEHARLPQVKLVDAFLFKALLSEADLRRANLRGAMAAGANFHSANLSEALLEGSNLLGANLANTNLSFTCLNGANLISADLEQAALSYASLLGADLTGARLDRANLSSVQFDETTILPDGSRWSPDVDMSQFTGRRL